MSARPEAVRSAGNWKEEEPWGTLYQSANDAFDDTFQLNTWKDMLPKLCSTEYEAGKSDSQRNVSRSERDMRLDGR